MGEAAKSPLRVHFDRRLKLEFRGITITSDAGLLAFAWRMDSTQGFHAIMNMVLLPLWLLSGAVFPAGGAHSWLGWIMAINPLSCGVAALRRTLYAASPEAVAGLPGLEISLALTIFFGLTAFMLAAHCAERSEG